VKTRTDEYQRAFANGTPKTTPSTPVIAADNSKRPIYAIGMP